MEQILLYYIQWYAADTRFVQPICMAFSTGGDIVVEEPVRDIRADLLARREDAKRRVEEIRTQISALEEPLREAEEELSATDVLYKREVARWERFARQAQLPLGGPLVHTSLQEAILLVLEGQTESSRKAITEKLKKEGFDFKGSSASGRVVQAGLMALKNKGAVKLIKPGIWSKKENNK